MSEARERAGAYILGMLAACRCLFECVRADRKARKAFRIAGWAILAALTLTAYTLCVERVAQKRALEIYAGWMEDYRVERMAIDQANEETDPYTLQLNAEATILARVLYGVKDNDTDDLKTYCWCVFNRVDNPAFPDTIEAVASQPQQWMRYDEDSPVLENLYQLAREQIDAWHTGERRPVGFEYVFMNWTPSDIVLRDDFKAGPTTRYWRWGQP